MLEQWELERGGQKKQPETDALNHQAWAPQIADGKAGAVQASESKTQKESAPEKESQGKKQEALRQHLDINDRCSLDLYENHWELTMPKTSALSGKFVIDKNLAVKHIPASEKLIMDKRGFWTMLDENGEQVLPVRRQDGTTYTRDVEVALDLHNQSKNMQCKERRFHNGMNAYINKDGLMILQRKSGSEEQPDEFTVVFDKNGVKVVVDKGQAFELTEKKDAK